MSKTTEAARAQLAETAQALVDTPLDAGNQFLKILAVLTTAQCHLLLDILETLETKHAPAPRKPSARPTKPSAPTAKKK